MIDLTGRKALITCPSGAIGEAIAENGRVIVTGCMGNEAELIRERFPQVLAVTGAHQYEDVVNAVHEASPPVPNAYVDLVPEGGLKLTPRHYSYLKISEGCNHRCAFCIIPSLRGDLASRRIEPRQLAILHLDPPGETTKPVIER